MRVKCIHCWFWVEILTRTRFCESCGKSLPNSYMVNHEGQMIEKTIHQLVKDENRAFEEMNSLASRNYWILGIAFFILLMQQYMKQS